jgi:hypothetical protein
MHAFPVTRHSPLAKCFDRSAIYAFPVDLLDLSVFIA